MNFFILSVREKFNRCLSSKFELWKVSDVGRQPFYSAVFCLNSSPISWPLVDRYQKLYPYKEINVTDDSTEEKNLIDNQIWHNLK